MFIIAVLNSDLATKADISSLPKVTEGTINFNTNALNSYGGSVYQYGKVVVASLIINAKASGINLILASFAGVASPRKGTNIAIDYWSATMGCEGYVSTSSNLVLNIPNGAHNHDLKILCVFITT